MRPPIDGGTILITGASSGIGRELARLFARRAGTLILTARRLDRLEALREEFALLRPEMPVHCAVCELAREDEIEAMLAAVEAGAEYVDVLVNNAGLGYQSLYEQTEWDGVRQTLAVNVTAPLLLTRRLLPGMLERKRGGILNISSGAGFAPSPGMAVYTGTKHFLNGWTETLRSELEGTGVVVTQSAPGPVTTEFGLTADIKVSVTGGLSEFFTISAEQCAHETLEGFERGLPLVIPGARFRLLMTCQRYFPPVVTRAVVRSFSRRLRVV